MTATPAVSVVLPVFNAERHVVAAWPSSRSWRRLGKTSSKYIARKNAEEIALPQLLARQAAYLEAEPAWVAAGSRMLLIDADDMPIAEMLDRFSHSEIDGFHLGGVGSILFNPTAMMRREAVVAVRVNHRALLCAIRGHRGCRG